MIKIILVDDHQIVRDGIKNLLESNHEYSVIAEAEEVEEALKLLAKLTPDFLITDISLSNSSGIELAKRARILYPDLPILVLSMHTSFDYINESLNVGASGYLLKDCTKHELFEAITKIMKREVYLSKSASQVLMNKALNKSAAYAININSVKEDSLLTRRELEILKLISDGLTNKEIALKLNLSVRTVDKHRFNILQKFNANNTAELLKKAGKLNLLNA